MCFGGSDNSQMIQMEQQQAAEARAKEATRQANITKGLAAIKKQFEGADTFDTVAGPSFKFTGKDFTAGGAVPGLPAGYTYATQNVGATAPTTRQVTTPFSGGGGGGSRNYSTDQVVPGTPGTPTNYVRGPDGKLYPVGSTITPTTQVKTGHSGGFDKGFYDKFRQGLIDFYTPDVNDQYRESRDETGFRLARAGLSSSSMADTEYAKLVKQRGKATADIANKADIETGKVRGNVNDQRKAITSQLYATEDPGVAASQALDAANKISLDEGDRSPLGDLFKLATVGAAGFGQGYNNQRTMSQIPGYNPAGATRVIGG
jgi:hypothetical protein